MTAPRRLHVLLTVVLGIVVAAGGVLLATGRATVRFGAAPQPAAPESTPEKVAEPPAGPTVERVAEPRAARFFRDGAPPTVDVFRYTGSPVEFWLEEEVDGKWVATLEMRKAVVEQMFGGQRDGQTVTGYVVWKRQISPGGEVWSTLRMSAGGPDGENAIFEVSGGLPLTLRKKDGGNEVAVEMLVIPGGAAARQPLRDEVALLDGTLHLHRGDQKVSRRVRLKCRPY